MSLLPGPQAEYFWALWREEWGPQPFLLGNASAGPQRLDPQPGHQPVWPSARRGTAAAAGARGEVPTREAAGKQENVPEAAQAVVGRKLRAPCPLSWGGDLKGFRQCCVASSWGWAPSGDQTVSCCRRSPKTSFVTGWIPIGVRFDPLPGRSSSSCLSSVKRCGAPWGKGDCTPVDLTSSHMALMPHVVAFPAWICVFAPYLVVSKI